MGSHAFFDALSRAGRRFERTPETEGLLGRVLERAVRAWPSLEPDAFLAQAAERLAEAEDLPAALEALRAEDFALACACAAGDARAIETFERDLLPLADELFSRMRIPATTAAEIKQDLRRLLFVAEGSRPPKVASYSGRGDLRAWLRVTASRHAWTARVPGRELPVEPDLLEACAGAVADHELDGLRARFGEEFGAAFKDAVSLLPKRERTLLRYRYVDGLTGDEIAGVLRVHRATVVRRLADAQATILEETKSALRQRLGLSDTECESLIRLVRSGIDVSLARVLERER